MLIYSRWTVYSNYIFKYEMTKVSINTNQTNDESSEYIIVTNNNFNYNLQNYFKKINYYKRKQLHNRLKLIENLYTINENQVY